MAYLVASASAFLMYGPRLDALAPVYRFIETPAGGFAVVLAFCLAGAAIAARAAFPGPRL